MNLLSLLDSFAHALGSLQLDDSDLGLIALLAGMVAGWRLTGWHEQLKARRAKIGREAPPTTRKPD
jgi:hypothetical protein